MSEQDIPATHQVGVGDKVSQPITISHAIIPFDEVEELETFVLIVAITVEEK